MPPKVHNFWGHIIFYGFLHSYMTFALRRRRLPFAAARRFDIKQRRKA